MFEPIIGVQVIGLGHKARHGKDMAAKIIHELRPRITQRFAFADSLKGYCGMVHGMTTKDGNLLQQIGKQKRAEDPEIWIREVYRQILEDKPKVALITDVRMQNEAAFIKALGGIMVKVRRTNRDGSLYVDTSRNPDDISENDLNDYQWDQVIENNRDADTLEAKVGQFFWSYENSHGRSWR